MYRLAHVRRLLPLVVVLVVAVGCSTSKPGEKTASPLPTKVVGTVPKQQTATVPSQYKGGDPVAGKKVFTSAGCAGCHTLKDAGAHGTIGPNLDQLKPPEARIVTQVENGGGPMPAFKGQLSAKQIQDVAAYVFTATHSS